MVARVWQGVTRAAVLSLLILAAQWSGPEAGSRQVDAVADVSSTASVVLDSPNGNSRVVVGLCEVAGKPGVACYDVSWRGTMVIRRATLGVDLVDSEPLGSNLAIVEVARRQGDMRYPVYPGKSSMARDHYREAVISLEERTAPHRRLDVHFRAYDDGVAFRYRFPEQPGMTTLTIGEERSTFAFDGEPEAHILPLDTFTTPYEVRYQRIPLKDVSPDALLGLPLLLEHPNGIWTALTEANLTDYAAMYVTAIDGRPGALTSRLSPRPDEPRVKVKAKAPHVSPWRVLMMADDPGRLIESNLVLNLNDPSVIEDTSWIKPGKTTFPWWNGYELGDAGFRGGLNTQTMKHYIDFCAETGIEYHSLDGLERAWYDGPINPYQGADITTSVPEIDLPEVIEYARQRGVRLRLWMHWEAARAHMKTAFPVYERWGIEGVMLDFMNRDDQEMVRFLHEAIQLAAKHRLTVTLHGAAKPTGLRRTYPNLLTSEAVMNLEYNKWDAEGISPKHELTVPFVRMLAGPLDFHQGSFRHVWPRAYTPRRIAPVVQGTRARALASYVVLENHLPMVADYPAAYRHQQGLALLAEIPATWDDTRVVSGAVGQYITIARRSGELWYVGSMTDGAGRKLTIPLDFLGPGQFVAEVYADDLDAPDEPSKLTRRRLQVSAADRLRAELAPAGGQVIRLAPR
ncbi:MAG: glycoside hydrolase family 97 protein [Luteitalea sp.]|nr:glycoside hydrolase family 97 protein [Luteitalea sp.]